MKESIHKNFENFYKNPTFDTLCELLCENFGETDLYDFKEEWQSWPKTAKHILGFSNSGGGGIIIGVSQNEDNTFNIKGLKNLIDKSDISQGVRKYIPNKLEYEVLDFSYEITYGRKELAGKKFQVIIIKDMPTKIPFVSNKGDEIRKGLVYIRKQGSTEPANYDELQEIINRRTRECDKIIHLERPNSEYDNMNSIQKIKIEKKEYTNFGIYKAKLYSYNHDRSVATIKISINENDIKCIAFGTGKYKFENYIIDVIGLNSDFVSLRISEIYTY
ncbi:MAG: RNA-binding domain-containing protein [Halobacteriota archaeon]